jgi:hypothetical protein
MFKLHFEHLSALTSRLGIIKNLFLYIYDINMVSISEVTHQRVLLTLCAYWYCLYCVKFRRASGKIDSQELERMSITITRYNNDQGTRVATRNE